MVPTNVYSVLSGMKGRLPLCHTAMIPWTADFVAGILGDGWDATRVMEIRELEQRGNSVLKDGISRYAKLINGAKLISWIYERYCVYDRTM